jgi:hypothetical protein
MKEKLKENLGNIIVLSIVLVLLICSIVLLANAIKDRKDYKDWYNSLSVEEQTVEREKYIQRYEIVNIHKYILPKTNGYGGVIGSEICYTFQYVNGDELKTISDFRDLKYGLTRVIIGDKNMYIIDDFNLDTYCYLQLTEETLKSLEFA